MFDIHIYISFLPSQQQPGTGVDPPVYLVDFIRI